MPWCRLQHSQLANYRDSYPNIDIWTHALIGTSGRCAADEGGYARPAAPDPGD